MVFLAFGHSKWKAVSQEREYVSSLETALTGRVSDAVRSHLGQSGSVVVMAAGLPQT